MRRVALFTVITSLVFTCAVPIGTVFASEEPIGELPTSLVSQTEEVALETENVAEMPPSDQGPSENVPVESAAVQSFAEEPGLKIQAIAAQSPPVVTQPVVELPVSPILITAYKASGAHVHAVQLYNNSSAMVSLDGVSLVYVVGGIEYEVPLKSGWIEPRSYTVIAWQGESEYADIEFQFDKADGGVLESFELYHNGFQPLIIAVPSSYSGGLLHRFKSAAGNYTTNTSFAAGEPTISGGGLYTLPEAPELSVREVLVNPRDCVYGFETADCYDFIKLRNDSTEPLDLSLYRLRSGYSNTSSTSGNTSYLGDVLNPGETLTLTHDKEGKRLSFTANDGTIWVEDTYGYKTYDLGVQPYTNSDLTAQTGRSWAFNDSTGQWQWATPAPYSEDNDFTPLPDSEEGSVSQPPELVPCRDNQYRSEETNRCRSIVVVSTLKPCSEGQYRSEETNRCRSIAATVASVLKPCADDQFRSPTTNRCKKIASSDEVALVDCGEGRERNPQTNRCRNVLGVSSLAETVPFPVEETPEGMERFAGWWVIGAVAALGAGYGIWEWRVELLGFGRRASRFVAGKK